MFKELKKWFGETLKDERGRYSSKRFLGIISGLTLCVVLILNSLLADSVKPSDTLVYSVAMLSFGCLGLGSIDKIWGRVQAPLTTETEEEPEEKVDVPNRWEDEDTNEGPLIGPE